MCIRDRFYGLAEQVDRGEIELNGTEQSTVKRSFRRFRNALSNCESSLNRMDSGYLELNDVRDGTLVNGILRSLKAHLRISQNQAGELKSSYDELRKGNARSAEAIVGHVREQGAVEEATKLQQAIDQAKVPLLQIQQLLKPVMQEYKRLNTPLRRAWGPGFGNVYDELNARLIKLNKAVQESPYEPKSELGTQVNQIIKSVIPVCELTEICLTWKKPRRSLTTLIRELKPRPSHPASIYILSLIHI